MSGFVTTLRAAREFLSDEAHWLRDGRFAHDQYDADIQSRGGFHRAVACCAYGACYRADPSLFEGAREKALEGILEPVARTFGSPDVVSFNDEDATHEELLLFFDKAIELAGAAES